MSSINIEVVDVTVETVPSSKGSSYEKCTAVYKGFEGKLEQKQLFSPYTPKPVWETIVNAKKGDTFSVEREKDSTGKYWNWTGISRQDTPVKTEGYKAPVKPTYETPEERAQRQVYIIKQSSISAAVALLGPKAKVGDVIKTAQIFVDYVVGNDVASMSDDPV